MVNVQQDGFDFLGYRFEGKSLRLREKSLVSFKDRVRGLTRRLDGNSLSTVIERLNAVLRGWFEVRVLQALPQDARRPSHRSTPGTGEGSARP